MARPLSHPVSSGPLSKFFMLSLAVLVAVGRAESAAAYSVAKVFPEGATKKVRQVRVRFSEPMVPFGDARPATPATVQCWGLPNEIAGFGRWLEPKEWVYDFSVEIPAGVNCRVSIRADRQSEKGGALTGKREFDFSTGGPAVTSTRPRDGDSVEEDSGFLLLTDAEVVPASILQHAYFVVEGLGEKIPVKLADKTTTASVLKSGHYYSYKGPAYVITAKRRFPAGKKVKLVWDQGIKAKTGVETAKSQSFTFRVREPFTAKFSCFRENEKADCSPLLAMQINFSTAIPRADVAKIQIKDKAGKILVPHKIDEKEETVSTITFDPPFDQKGQFTISIDNSVKDETGQTLQNAAKFPVTARTTNFQPLAKFAANFGIIEARGGAALPVTVRRLEKGVAAKFGRSAHGQGKGGKEIFGFEIMKGKSVRVESPKEIMYWLNRLENIDREISLFDKARRFAKDEGSSATGPDGPDGFRGQDPETTTFELPQPEKEGDTNVIGIPLKKTGFYVVEIESKSLGAALLGKDEPMYVPAEALVTNMAVHFKWGGERSLAWVTSLDSGKTVANALVQIFDCKGASLFEGKTDRDGLVDIENLPLPAKVASCEARRTSKYTSGVFVFASKWRDPNGDADHRSLSRKISSRIR